MKSEIHEASCPSEGWQSKPALSPPRSANIPPLFSSSELPAPPQRSLEWFKRLIQVRIGHPEPRDWQITLSKAKYEGKEVFAILPTGSGKSVLIHAPILAAKELGERKIALVIVPTKALGSNHLEAAQRYGIEAVAINEDTLRDASKDGRNLYEELAEARHRLGIILPDQLLSADFAKLLKSDKFMSALSFVDVDEAHIWDTWGAGFRKAQYKAISNLRHRIPSAITWLGLTATLIPGDSEKRVLEGLGFRQYSRSKRLQGDSMGEDLIFHRIPIDRPSLKVTTRFLSHGLTNEDFPDLHWLISLLVRQSPFAEKTVISCGTIDLATRLYEWMQSYLPHDHPTKDWIVKPFHSLISADGRQRIIEEFAPGGATQVILATDCMAHGVDVDADLAVLLPQKEERIEEITQWMGRAGRRGVGQAIVYAHDWMRKETELDRLPKKEGGKGMTAKAIAERREKRSKVGENVVGFFNPTPGSCTRAALSSAYHEPYSRPVGFPCCDNCNPDHFHLAETDRFNKMLASLNGEKPTPLTTDSTFYSLVGTEYHSEALAKIRQWRSDQWRSWPRRNAVFPPSQLLYDYLVLLLCNKLHIITTYERFCTLLQDWPYLEQYGVALYTFAFDLIQDIDRRHRLTRLAKAGTQGNPDGAAANNHEASLRPILGERNASPPPLALKHPRSPTKPKANKRARRVGKEDVPPPSSAGTSRKARSR